MRRNMWLGAALVLVLGAVVAGCGGYGGDNKSKGGGNEELTVNLSAQNGSGENGTATLTAAGDNQTKVVIDVSNGSSTPQPAHIHDGTCAKLNPQPEYALNNVVNGKSTSTVNASLDDLESEPYAINIHKSAADLKTYVSCGGFGKGESGGEEGGEGY